MRAPNRRRSARRGAAAIEFAFWFVTFIYILVGIVDLSYFLNIYIIVQRAARDGVRHGATVLEDPPVTGDAIEQAAEDHATLVLETAGLVCDAGCTVQADWQTVDGRAWLDIHVAYPVTSLTHLFPYPIDQVSASFSMLTQEQGT
jgi:Flp pilus assembly protein TadG